jgi:CubicO group peptidase (beta-lactamase class C family)
MTFEIPRAEKPEDVGFSSGRLARITDVLSRDIEAGIVPGAVVLIARKGKIVLHKALGLRDREANASMKLDTVFRIASMTKPLTSVAAMMLAEEGKLIVAEPAANYLPEFADIKILVDSDNATTLATEPCRRPMTVQDLLRHTSGLTYAPLTGPALKQAYSEAGVGDLKLTNAEFTARLGKLPLAYQPGNTWQYGLSTDVLGRVVEAVSGTTLDAFIEQRICKPLGMSSSGFNAVDASRAAEPQVDPTTGKRPPMLREALVKPAWISGGSGLMSTAADYLRFCQMLLDGGALGETRLVSPATVALMTSDHQAPDIGHGPQMRNMFGALAPVPENGIGFGLGFAVRKEAGRCALPGSVGDYSWSGVSGTYFWIDPREQLIAILMMQAPLQRMRYRYLMRMLVYQALVG